MLTLTPVVCSRAYQSCHCHCTLTARYPEHCIEQGSLRDELPFDNFFTLTMLFLLSKFTKALFLTWSKRDAFNVQNNVLPKSFRLIGKRSIVKRLGLGMGLGIENRESKQSQC